MKPARLPIRSPADVSSRPLRWERLRLLRPPAPWGDSPLRKDEIRVGVIGCGGRGTGAAMNALQASPDVRIHALGDLFADRMTSSRNGLRGQVERYGDRASVPDENCFAGWGRLSGCPCHRLRLRHPRHASRLPSAALRSRDRSRQACLHGEACRGRSGGHPQGPRRREIRG